ncbi:MAG: hypothetical protein ACJAQR_000864 [Bacteroidia bacterium]|jgi:hypothetical protein
MNINVKKINVMMLVLGMSFSAQAQNWKTDGSNSGTDQLGTNSTDNLNIVTNGQTRIVVKGTDGNVGIGTDKTTGYKLSVEGKIRAREVVINLDTWADYVFADSFILMPIETLASYIKAEKHLPGIPSEKEVVEEGLSLAAMQVSMMQKIEELTLYIIQLQKQIDDLNTKEVATTEITDDNEASLQPITPVISLPNSSTSN